MIPYDDLVAALTNWRAKQGLPVAQTPTVSAGSEPSVAATTESGPVAVKPGSGPTRTPPTPPPGRTGGYAPPPLAQPDTQDDSLDVEEAALLEESHYENEGDDFALNFSAATGTAAPAPDVAEVDEMTAIGGAPERDSFGGETELDPSQRDSDKTHKPW